MPLTTFNNKPLKDTHLFKPIKVGSTDLKHRLVMAPLSRYRADDEYVPTEEMVEYYSQRAQYPGSLLISEATFISAQAGGYAKAPGLWNANQIDAWKRVIDAVHAKNSKFYFQLWALGHAANPAELGKHGLPYVSPSGIYYSIEAEKEAIDAGNPLRTITKEEIQQYIKDYVTAAKNAIAAGADGVEIHNANGYLLHQFMNDSINKRTDEYGGSIENRSRFSLQVVDALINAIGADRVAIRLSPYFTGFGFTGKELLSVSQHAYLLAELEERAMKGNRLAFVHLVEPRAETFDHLEIIGDNKFAATIWKGHIIKAGHYGNRPDDALRDSKDDRTLIAYGRYYISTPDLISRLEHGQPLNEYDRDTFFQGGVVGYTDYPNYSETVTNLTADLSI